MLAFGIFLILLFFVSLISHRPERTIITAPIIFTLGGMSLVWTQLVEPEPVAVSHLDGLIVARKGRRRMSLNKNW